MGFLIGFLTVVLALDCVFLILLILIQLPKKEAGAGTAFGGQATDALFGAGTGNALTRITKYAAGIFFVLAVILATLNANLSPAKGSKVREALKQQAAAAATAPANPSAVPGAGDTLGKPVPAAPASLLLNSNAAAKPQAVAPAAPGTNAAHAK